MATGSRSRPNLRLEATGASQVLQKYFPGGFFGEDREGHPVYYDFYGNIDIKGLYRSCKTEDIIKLKVYHGELTTKVLREFSEKKGRHIETITAVLNMENLSYQRQYHWPSIQVIRELFKIFADNYPERSKSVYIINAPRVFPVAYNIVKHFIEEDTRKKLIIMGDNWTTELQKYISPDQLPQAYGGTCCLPDPQCSSYINWGGVVPEEYYMTNNTETSRDNMESVTVGRASSHQLEVEVDTEESYIRWEYMSVDFDIGFGMFYKPAAVASDRRTKTSDMTTIVPMKRSNSHIYPESGLHQCKQSGTYVLKFDNSYSWTRTKEVLYSIQILPPAATNDISPPIFTVESDNDEDEFQDCLDSIDDSREMGVVSDIGGRVNNTSLEEN